MNRRAMFPAVPSGLVLLRRFHTTGLRRVATTCRHVVAGRKRSVRRIGTRLNRTWLDQRGLIERQFNRPDTFLNREPFESCRSPEVRS